mgnify:CR=1 FL=1
MRVAIPDYEMHEIRASLANLHEKMDTLIAEIGPGLPPRDQRDNRPTIRSRLHMVEHDRDAIETLANALAKQLTAVSEVVGDLKRERDEEQIAAKALATAEAAQAHAWSRPSKIALFAFAALGAIGTLLSISRVLIAGGF